MAKKLESQGNEVTLFAPARAIKKIQDAIPSTQGLTFQDFATQTTPEKIAAGHREATEWLDRLPDLNSFEKVICDNLPEILERRTDAELSAQFFWHDIVESIDNSYRRYCENLLELVRPVVLGNDLFSMESVRSQPGFQSVDLYKSPELVDASKSITVEDRTDLLLTGGTTRAVKQELAEIIAQLVQTGPYPYRKIHVDPELLPDDAPDWLVRADFTPAMYCRLKAAICRPGLGVLTDLLTVGVKPSVIFEEGNPEMAHNAAVVQKLK